jgi:4-hydroxybenzoate polyprenyltransferase
MTTLTHAIAPARLLTPRFWRDYLVTMRPYLLFVSGVTGIAGLALAPDPAPVAVVLLGVAFFLAYGFGQALTDCFQLDTDSLSAPYRPLVRGDLRPTDVAGVSLAGLAACGLVVTAHDPRTLPLAGLTVLGLASYTWFKRRWWGGPFYNAWIVSLVLLIGYVAAGGLAIRTPAVAGALVAAFFGYANFVLVGYYKDIPADRATGYRTLPVAYGLRTSSVVSDGFALLALAGVGLSLAASLSGRGPQAWILAAPFALAALGCTLVAQVRTHQVRSDRDAHRAIGPVVHAYLFQLTAVAVAAKPAWALGLLLFYAGFVHTLRHRPMQEQI